MPEQLNREAGPIKNSPRFDDKATPAPSICYSPSSRAFHHPPDMVCFGVISGLLKAFSYPWLAFCADLRIPILKLFAIGRETSFELGICGIILGWEIVRQSFVEDILVLETI